MLDLRAQFRSLERDVRAALDQVLASQQFVLGPQLEAFERELAHYAGRRYAVGVASGTDALILSLRACDVAPGDEVILPAFTFIATAGAVAALGATPVFADSDPATLQIDPASVAARITPRTAAIIAVHLYGAAADAEALSALATEHRLVLIEDNAQSLGASVGGRKLGSFGTVGTTSFYPSKNLGAFGDAGMAFTDSEEIALRLARLRNHGQSGRYVSGEVGWNSRLDELQAAVLRVKLKHLDAWIAARRSIARRYDDAFRACDAICPLATPAGHHHTYYAFTVRIPGSTGHPAAARDHVARHLAERQIASSVFYPVPLHLQPAFETLGGKAGDLPVAERAAHEVLSLPIYPEMSEKQVDRVADAVLDALRR